MSDRIQVEDALKCLAELEYEGTPARAAECAEAAGLSEADAARLVGKLTASGLVEEKDGVLALTGKGREYALHVMRAHRLYETYLAQTTGLSAASWHKRAHVREHELTDAEVESIARELGEPSFDPHGDPIPSARGELPPKRGEPLTRQARGWAGRVVHVEDEPPRLYAKIAAAGLAPGVVVRVDGVGPDHIDVRLEGRTVRLPAEAAAQVSAAALGPGESFDETVERLSGLRDREKAEVVGLSPLCRGLERSRLLDLGVVPGTVIERELSSPAGSPVAYRVRGAAIALRTEQAERVLIRRGKG